MCMFFFFQERHFLFETEISVVKLVKFTRDSGCLARDDFLVIFKEDHILMYMCTFAIVLLLGTVLHCTT